LCNNPVFAISNRQVNEHMKSIIQYILCISLISIVSLKSEAQVKQDSTTHFTVFGECGQCKERIEAAVKGRAVSQASWDETTQQLTITYNPSKVKLRQLHRRIAAVGHDTELEKADDAIYKALPDCCHYREGEVHHDEGEDERGAVEGSAVMPVVKDKPFSGIVLEEKENGAPKPLEGATILWHGTIDGTVSDSTGKFFLSRNPKTNKVVISYTGYTSDTISLEENVPLQIVLKANSTLGTVTVKASKASLFLNTTTAIRSYDISSKELLKAACCNLSESFETNPSVDVTFNDAVTGSKQIQLLGLAGPYTQLTVENLPGPRGLATPLGLNSIPGTWVESMQLIKGTGSVVNGFESIAGQINVELKKPDNSEQLYVNAYYNQIGKTDLNLNLTRQLNKKWSTALLLHDAFADRTRDMNNDMFKDFPTGNLFSVINRWSFTNGKGLFSEFGFKYLKDDKLGGDVNFNPDTDKYSTHHYGLEINIDRKELFAKVGYVFPNKTYKSIGLQLAAFEHKQDSYFGTTIYNGNQKNFYGNLIYQSQISGSEHKFKTGVSFIYDGYEELFKTTQYNRNEIIPGAFFEYIFKPSNQFDIIAGIRGDYNSLFGFFASPRLNVRYEPIKGTTIRVSAGRGQRTANVFAENNSVMVSSRQLNIISSSQGKAYGLDPEVAWNKGISIDQKLRLFGSSSTISVDFFRNDFTNQVVVDLEDPRQVKFYNLDGKSYSNSFQAEWSMSPFKDFNVRLAYRLFDVKTSYEGTVKQRPLNATHRAFTNLAYEIDGWAFDFTASYTGQKRITSTASNPQEYQWDEYSPGYVLMNSQVSKTLGKKWPFDLYVGVENLGNFTQNNPIIAADQPFSPWFDASMVWGPINGRMFYAGFRFKIK
jgi:outer membrane receptor for ferrienterochelin and colicins